MSKRIEYPNGYVGVASDKAAANLAKKPGHKVLGDAKAQAEKKPEQSGDKGGE